MRWVIARFCCPRKVVCRVCRLVSEMGYVIRGLKLGVGFVLMITLLGASCSWTG